MPIQQKMATQIVDYLPDFFDTDDGGREVPVNMTLTAEGFLQKDTGIDDILSSFTFPANPSWNKNFKQKNGSQYMLVASGFFVYLADLTKLQAYPLPSALTSKGGTIAVTAGSNAIVGTGTTFTIDLVVGDFISIGDSILGTATITIASPAVVTKATHGLVVNDIVRFTTTGALPTGLAVDTNYYVIATGLTANDFQLSATLGGTAINTSGTQSGTHTLIKIGALEMCKVSTITDNTHLTVDVGVTHSTASGLPYLKNTLKTFSAGGLFGSIEYLDVLYFGNAVDDFAAFDGRIITSYSTLPKGNIYEVFEDRIFVAGVISEPLNWYYSDTAKPTTFSATSILKPLGTDYATGSVNYYGSLILLKRNSIWRMSFVFDQVLSAFVPKLELLNRNYGCCGFRAYTWVENDVWFFTGSEVRALGFKNQQIGVLGVDPSVISNNIKETLKKIISSEVSKTVLFYNDRKAYLCVPLSSTNDTVFISHLLYKQAWCKIKGRKKGYIRSIDVRDGVVYFSSSNEAKLYRWNSNFRDINSAISAYVNFKEYENKDFSANDVFRYIDIKFKNLQSKVKYSYWTDFFDLRQGRSKTGFIGTDAEGQENSLGEVPFGENLVADSFGEDVTSTNFIKRRISLLQKASSIAFGLANDVIDESFTICAYEISALKRPRRYYSPNKIISL